MGIAAVQRHIEDKARVVWDGYLRSALSSLAIPGVSDRIGALKIAIGVDPLDLPGSAVDTLPRVDLYCVGAESAYDIAGTNLDASFVYHIAAIAQYDESDPSASARSAAALAGESAEVLEQYLRDKTGGAGCIWRVDITAPVQVQAGTFDVSETRVHTMIATTEVTVQTRTTFADSPTYADPTIDPGNPTLFVQLADITSGLDASTGVGTAEANRLSTWTTTTAALAGATSLDVDASLAFAWGPTQRSAGGYAVRWANCGVQATGWPWAVHVSALVAKPACCWHAHCCPASSTPLVWKILPSRPTVNPCGTTTISR